MNETSNEFRTYGDLSGFVAIDQTFTECIFGKLYYCRFYNCQMVNCTFNKTIIYSHFDSIKACTLDGIFLMYSNINSITDCHLTDTTFQFGTIDYDERNHYTKCSFRDFLHTNIQYIDDVTYDACDITINDRNLWAYLLYNIGWADKDIIYDLSFELEMCTTQFKTKYGDSQIRNLIALAKEKGIIIR